MPALILVTARHWAQITTSVRLKVTERRWQHRYWPYLLIFATAFVVYAPVLLYAFVWDDYAFILNNERLHQWLTPWQLLTDKSTFASIIEYHHTAYRPLRTFIYNALYMLVGADPYLYHLINVVLHAMVSCMVVLLAEQWRFSRTVAVAAALLFAVHPMHTEAVTWISSLNDPLFAFFYLLSLHAWWRQKPGASLWALLWFGLALLSKEMAATLPLVVVLLKRWHEGDWRFLRRKSFQWSWGMHGLLLVIYLIWRQHVLGGVGQTSWQEADLIQTLLHLPWVLCNYMRMLILPLAHNAFIPRLETFSWYEPRFIISLLTCMAVGLVCIYKRTYRQQGWLLLVWLVMLLPVLGFLPMWIDLAERFIYLPSMLICLLAADLLLRIPGYWGRYSRRYYFVAVLLLLCIGLTVQRNQVWRSDLAIATDNVKQSPEHDMAYFNLAGAATRQQAWDTAVAAYEYYLRYRPATAQIMLNLSAAYFGLNRYAQAEHAAQQAVQLDPQLCMAWWNLHLALTHLGKTQTADRVKQRALKCEKP